MSLNGRAFIKSAPLLLAALYSACSGNATYIATQQLPPPIVTIVRSTATPSAIPPTATPTATPYPLPASLDDVLAYEEGLKYVSNPGCFITSCYESLLDYIKNKQAVFFTDPILGPTIGIDVNRDGHYDPNEEFFYLLLGYDGMNRGHWYLTAIIRNQYEEFTAIAIYTSDGTSDGTNDGIRKNSRMIDINVLRDPKIIIKKKLYVQPIPSDREFPIEYLYKVYIEDLNHSGTATIMYNRGFEPVAILTMDIHKLHKPESPLKSMIDRWIPLIQSDILPDVVRSHRQIREYIVINGLLVPTPTP